MRLKDEVACPPNPRLGHHPRLKWRARTLSALSIQSVICTVMLIVLLYALCPQASGADSEIRHYCAPLQFVYAAFVLDNLLMYLPIPSMGLQIDCKYATSFDQATVVDFPCRYYSPPSRHFAECDPLQCGRYRST